MEVWVAIDASSYDRPASIIAARADKADALDAALTRWESYRVGQRRAGHWRWDRATGSGEIYYMRGRSQVGTDIRVEKVKVL